MDERDIVALMYVFFVQKEWRPTVSIKLNSAPATAETWHFKGHTLRVNAFCYTFIARDFLFINLVPLFCQSCKKTHFIAEDEGEVGLRFISYISSN
jgi:hypothetical protein